MNRNEVADFWDDYILAWIQGEESLEKWLFAQDPSISDDLMRWMNSYRVQVRGRLIFPASQIPIQVTCEGQIGSLN